MASSTIALIILVVFVVMLMSGKFPFSVSCAIMALCMVWFLPELKLSDIYSGFARNIILLIAGMCIIGDALFRTGVANDIGQMICRSGFAKTEKIFICTIAVVVTLQSAFMSNNGTIAMWMPLIATIAAGSNGKIRSKMCIFPAGAAACIGGGCTMAGSSAQATVSNILMEVPGFEGGLAVYEMTKLMWPCIILQVIFWATIGYKLEVWAFKPGSADFDVGNAYAAANYASYANDENAFADVPKWKKRLTLGVLIGCIVGFALCSYAPFKNFLDLGTIPLIGCLILFLTHTIEAKEAYKNLPMDLLVGCCFTLVLATAMTSTGAGQVIADAVFGVIGYDLPPAVLLTVFTVLGGFLTLFCNNFVPGAVLTPIAIACAQTMGVSPLPFAVAIACAINLAIATPIGTPVNQLIMPAGYKPVDYVKVGGPLWAILMASIIVMSLIVYPF